MKLSGCIFYGSFLQNNTNFCSDIDRLQKVSLKPYSHGTMGWDHGISGITGGDLICFRNYHLMFVFLVGHLDWITEDF